MYVKIFNSLKYRIDSLLRPSTSVLHTFDYCSNKPQSSSSPLDELRFSGEFPRDRIKTKFTLASGPGGMNVNKVATKCELRFNVDEADWLPARLREHFVRKHAADINKHREFIITSMVARAKVDNLEDCYRKLRVMLCECSDELIEQLREPSAEDIEILRVRKEDADRIRRLIKERRAAKRRDRQIF